MSYGLRRRLERLEDRAGKNAPPPLPGADIDADPHLRLAYTRLALPVELHEALRALKGDPRLPAIEAEAERRAPALAAGVRELDAAVEAHERGDPLSLPRPTEAIGAARQHLFTNPADIIDVPTGRAHRRTLGVTYDVSDFEDAVTAVVDHAAYLVWNLDRNGSNFLADRHVDAVLQRWAAEHPEGEA